MQTKSLSAGAKLAKLYAQVPTFKCVEGCTDCCGPVPFHQEEWRKIKDKRQAEGIDCPYSSTGHCEIYTQRPFICRLFGTVATPLLTCPHGCGPEKKLTEEEGRALMQQYARI